MRLARPSPATDGLVDGPPGGSIATRPRRFLGRRAPLWRANAGPAASASRPPCARTPRATAASASQPAAPAYAVAANSRPCERMPAPMPCRRRGRRRRCSRGPPCHARRARSRSGGVDHHRRQPPRSRSWRSGTSSTPQVRRTRAGLDRVDAGHHDAGPVASQARGTTARRGGARRRRRASARLCDARFVRDSTAPSVHDDEDVLVPPGRSRGGSLVPGHGAMLRSASCASTRRGSHAPAASAAGRATG
jgi:hypothetical protein